MDVTDPLYTADRSVNHTVTMEISVEVPHKLKIELPHDLCMPLVGIKISILVQRHTCPW